MQLTKLKSILDEVAPSYYLSFSPKDVEEIKTPIIVFSKINVTFKEFSDDLASIRTTLYQINLITSDVKEADVLAKTCRIKSHLAYVMFTMLWLLLLKIPGHLIHLKT